MEATKGDRILLEAKKVGQPRRSGVVLGVTQGISGVRYNIRWDDGSESFIAPGPGALIIEGSARKKSGAATTKRPARKATKRRGS